MINWDKEQYIREIERKLSSQVPLSCSEIKTVIAALRESKECYQEPYFEVVYHDKYGKCQSRIMNPDYQSITKEKERFNLLRLSSLYCNQIMA